MKTLVLAGSVLAALSIGRPAVAQDTEKASILSVVQKLFDGMRTRDTALMRSLFAPHARMVMIDARSGTPTVNVAEPTGWISAVGKGSGPAWDERIFDPVVSQHDRLAQVWTYYEFWRGSELSHCGYDAFTFVKLADGWRIVEVSDTRQSGCQPRSK